MLYLTKQNINFFVIKLNKRNKKTHNLLMSGVKSEDLGVCSMITNWNTEKASKTVTPSETFSPESGGSQNTISAIVITNMAGRMILIT